MAADDGESLAELDREAELTAGWFIVCFAAREYVGVTGPEE